MKKTKLSSTIVWLGLIVAIILMATNTKATILPETIEKLKPILVKFGYRE